MESVGDYEYNTKDLIGHGAFAVVFKGRVKMKHKSTVAIKCIMKKNLAKSQNLLAKEIKILKELAELNHENVVALLDCKETCQHVYLVMEYCNGGDLADYLNAKGKLGEDIIYLFLRQIAAAMKALNAKGIVHRDLKPQNILLCYTERPNPPPNEIQLKIADFGFSRFLQDGIMAVTLCGSPMYMAPEVIMSLQYDAKADLWSIGTIVYQCLTGKVPFQAQTPQALKQFYEKNNFLFPKIPSWTSADLTDLLIRLLKKNAKDRLEFDDFFSHPFLEPLTRTSSPMPVPSRQSVPLEASPSNSSIYNSPISGNLPPSPQGWCGSRDEPLIEAPTTIAASPLLDKRSSGDKERNSSSSLEDQGFVMVTNDLAEQSGSQEVGSLQKMLRAKHGRCIVYANSSPKALCNVPDNHYSSGTTFNTHRVSEINLPQPSSLPMSGSPAKQILEVGTYQQSEPIPVPSQKTIYEQIQRSLERDLFNSSMSQGERALSTPSTAHMYHGSSPNTTKAVSEPITLRKVSMSSQSSEQSQILIDICSLSPPTVQFTIGTPPGGTRRCSYSGGVSPTFSGRQTPTIHHQSYSPPPPTLSTSPLRRSNIFLAGNLLTLATGNPLSPILDSPSKEFSRTEQPLMEMGWQQESPKMATNETKMHRCRSFPSTRRIGFSMRAITLPEICSQQFWPGSGYETAEPVDNKKCNVHRSESSGRLGERMIYKPLSVPGSQHMSRSPPGTVMMPYGHPTTRCFINEMVPHCGSLGHLRRSSTGCCLFSDSFPTNPTCFTYGGTSSPIMEGPHMFVAPELPEETILEKEHNETLARLNFVLALVECVLDLAKSKGTPLASLTESFMKNQNQPGQMSFVTERYRRIEQLVLFVRALQLLSSSLQLAQQEVQVGHLSPSTSVRNALQTMKEQFHYCLTMCKSLKSQGTLEARGMDPNSYSITADKLIYNYAIEMCQSAAIEELFGNPEVCFRHYQRAQILLHSLAQQITDERDRKLLNKYKYAVECRLFVLQGQGYIQAYDTTRSYSSECGV
ncbi:serine/threonine-protein kinase unc-51-like isoform X1 [Limulus polyphemus]|uniref:non-specific serine/threonine protein kinase n=3 Tax=Limulus polyphemus TaxID=6850 RepID=A0ABM1SJV6_LIMPO|nr:serine/threonine-protein kinase unc-51-like isoform X1 [Limulus polyphemus]